MLCASVGQRVFGFLVVFFFFKQKTAYEMRISDWSSDVCSSDLDDAIGHQEDCQIERERRIAGDVRGQDLTALCGEFVDQRRTELGAAIDIIVSTSRRPGTGVAPSAQAVRFTERLLAEQARMNSRCQIGRAHV